MIQLALKNGKWYLEDGTALPKEELMKYRHYLEENKGKIYTDIDIRDKVTRWY